MSLTNIHAYRRVGVAVATDNTIVQWPHSRQTGTDNGDTGFHNGPDNTGSITPCYFEISIRKNDRIEKAVVVIQLGSSTEMV